MTRLLGNILGAVFFPARIVGRIADRIAGPIFTKELRVSSRRRHTYVLRLGYLAALGLFVGLMWAAFLWPADTNFNSTAGQVAAMSEAGKGIILCIVWFQFCVVQLIAVVLLSTSISEEVRRRTLGVLLSTPITSGQVVRGKLLSKLLQILVLLAISLPLLAIVRVFGGVPWDFVLTGLCITFCAVIFAGSVSLLLSITSRHAYVVIIETILALTLLYLLLPVLLFLSLAQSVGERAMLEVFLHCNPFLALSCVTEEMVNPGRIWGGIMFSWPLCCGVLLGAAAGVLALAAAVVRRATLRQATGQTDFLTARQNHDGSDSTAAPANGSTVAEGTIRRIDGCPVLWKEMRTPLIRDVVVRGLVIIGFMGVVALTYAVCAAAHILSRQGTHVVYGLVFLIFSCLCTAILAATPITAEREAGTWPTLLQTALTEEQILWGKTAGVLRRCLILWLPLLAHVGLFTLAGCINPISWFFLVPVALAPMMFLTASGLYFSSRCRKTTTAVILNLALAVLLWVVGPFVLEVLWGVSFGFYKSLAPIEGGSPFVQVIVVLEATYQMGTFINSPGLVFAWPSGHSDAGGSFFTLWGWTFAYSVAAGEIYRRTLRRLRKVIY